MKLYYYLIIGLLVMVVLISGCVKEETNEERVFMSILEEFDYSHCELNCKNMGFNSGECKKTSLNATCKDRYNMTTLTELVAISGNVCPLKEVNQNESFKMNILPEESIECCCNK